MRKATMTAVVLTAYLSSASCGWLFPFSPDNMSDTRVRAICSFLFNCCEANERQFVFGGLNYKDEATCVTEITEEGGLSATDNLAKDTIRREAGEFDQEAAEECSREVLTAMQQCDVGELTTRTGEIDILKILFLADSSDPTCFALVQRGYVRGNVGDGDDCQSSIDCDEFGVCELENDEDTIKLEGECRALEKKGGDCLDEDFIACQPGLACEVDGNDVTCQKPDLVDNGDPCVFNEQCDSGFCRGEGLCFDAATPCSLDTDCGPEDFCDIEDGGVCAAPPKVKVEVCDGRE
jgi:hypothetical protein